MIRKNEREVEINLNDYELLGLVIGYIIKMLIDNK
jgi:hypothetical protein